MKNLISRHIFTGTLVMVITLFAGVLGYFVWTLDRGFEITDESYYLLLAMHPAAVKLFNSAQHWFTPAIWQLTGSLFSFRLAGMLLLLGSSAILSQGIIHVYSFISSLKEIKRSEKMIVYVSSLAGALLYGATINFSPCYNLLASATSYAAVGLVLLAFGSRPTYNTLLLYFLSGCLLGISTLNKFSSGLGVMCLGVLFILTFSDTLRAKILGTLTLIAGLSVVSLFFLFYHSIHEDILDEFRFGMSVFKMVQTEPGAHRLGRYASEFLIQMLVAGGLALIPLAYLRKHSPAADFARYSRYIILAVILFTCIYFHKTIIGEWHHRFSDTPTKWVLAVAFFSTLLVITLVATFNTWAIESKVIILTGGLIVLPYCIAVGTGNPIHTQIVDSLAPWGGVIAILVVINSYKESRKGWEIIAPVFFVSIVAVQAALCSFVPYHLGKTIWSQTVPTRIGSIGMVKTDKESHDFITKLSEVKQQFPHLDDQPYLGFYGVPGVAVILDVIPVFSPWLTLPKQSELMLSRVSPDILQSSLVGVILESDGKMPELPGQLLSFPDEYKICKELNCPYVNRQLQIWAPVK